MKKLFFLTTAVILSFLVWGQSPSGYAIGDAVQPFSLKNIDGKTIALGDYKNAKGFIVVFTCNECPYAKAYQDRIIALDKKYSPLGFPVIAVNANDGNAPDSYEKMQARAREKGFPFPYLSDPGQAVTRQFGATNTPHTFVIERKGNEYILRYAGAIDNDTENVNPQKTDYVTNAVDALLANKDIAITKTKAIGCGIKWKKG